MASTHWDARPEQNHTQPTNTLNRIIKNINLTTSAPKTKQINLPPCQQQSSLHWTYFFRTDDPSAPKQAAGFKVCTPISTNYVRKTSIQQHWDHNNCGCSFSWILVSVPKCFRHNEVELSAFTLPLGFVLSHTNEQWFVFSTFRGHSASCVSSTDVLRVFLVVVHSFGFCKTNLLFIALVKCWLANLSRSFLALFFQINKNNIDFLFTICGHSSSVVLDSCCSGGPGGCSFSCVFWFASVSGLCSGLSCRFPTSPLNPCLEQTKWTVDFLFSVWCVSRQFILSNQFSLRRLCCIWFVVCACGWTYVHVSFHEICIVSQQWWLPQVYCFYFEQFMFSAASLLHLICCVRLWLNICSLVCLWGFYCFSAMVFAAGVLFLYFNIWVSLQRLCCIWFVVCVCGLSMWSLVFPCFFYWSSAMP